MRVLDKLTRKTFNLNGDPFLDDIRAPEDLYMTKDAKYIRMALYQSAKNAGMLAVIGESGSGKSTLRKDLLHKIANAEDKIKVIAPKSIDKKKLTASSICEAIIDELSDEYPKNSLEGRARQVERLLTASSRAGYKHVLMIEEAHDLKIATLKYLKRFWELEDGFTRLLGIVLIGQPELKRLLDERLHYDAREVIARMEIAELLPISTPTDLKAYLTLKFARVGASLSSFVDDRAIEVLMLKLNTTATPLRINNAMRWLLAEASAVGATKITKDRVELL